MHVEMKNSLTCSFSIILYNIKSVTVKSVCQFTCHFFCQEHCFCSKFIRYLINISHMTLGNDQRMSFTCRSQVQDHTKILILIQCCSRYLAICDLTKNTRFHLSFLLLFSLCIMKCIPDYIASLCIHQLCRDPHSVDNEKQISIFVRNHS